MTPSDPMTDVETIFDVKVLATSVDVSNLKALHQRADDIFGRMGSGVLFLAGVTTYGFFMVVRRSDDLTGRVHAGRILGAALEAVSGRGGGTPDRAQGRCDDSCLMPRAISAAFCNAAEQLSVRVARSA